MNMRKIVSGLMGVAVAMSLFGKAATAQGFLLSTTVGPNAGTQGATYSVSNGGGGNFVFTGVPSGAATTPTDVTLASITETGGAANTGGPFTAPFTIMVTLTPQLPPAPGQSGPVSGTVSGSFSFTSSSTSAIFSSAPLVFNFGNRGTYTVGAFNYVRPGPQSQGGVGNIAATVTYASAVPEPGTWATFAVTGVGMMGLMLRARKGRGSLAS